MSNLQQMRETWRPRLAHSVLWMVRLIAPACVIVFIARPEAGEYALGLAVAIFGFAAALFGIRQWGKNAGVNDAQSD